MHYKNGRPVQDGDLAIGRSSEGKVISGRVLISCPGSDTCNVSVFSKSLLSINQTWGPCLIYRKYNPTAPGEEVALADQSFTANARDLLHADDALGNLEALGGCPPWTVPAQEHVPGPLEQVAPATTA